MRRGFFFLFLAGIALSLFGVYRIIMDKMKGPRWENLLPDMRAAILATLKDADLSGLKVMFWDGWRSPEEEKAHIASGASQLTDPYNTAHAWGFAADIVFQNAAGGPSWPELSDPRWQQLIAVAKRHGLTHPISWDGPHFQLEGYSVKSARADYGQDYRSFLADNGVSA